MAKAKRPRKSRPGGTGGAEYTDTTLPRKMSVPGNPGVRLAPSNSSGDGPILLKEYRCAAI